jgi:SAM-dependent methyltransferase
MNDLVRAHSTIHPADIEQELDAPPAGEASESLAAIRALLVGHFGSEKIAIYEAGGGSTSYLPRSLRERATVTVIDIDAIQLAHNTYADEKILGDIQTHSFGAARFDLIVCYNVIEHLPNANMAFRNFVEAIRPGGLILIGAPNPRSLSGFVTKYSPHWFHVWYYRRILGNATAGLPGHAPFPTHFHPLVTPDNLRAYAEKLGLEIVYQRLYESPRYTEMRARTPFLARLVDGTTALLNALLFNRVNVRHGDYHLIIQKKNPA